MSKTGSTVVREAGVHVRDRRCFTSPWSPCISQVMQAILLKFQVLDDMKKAYATKK